ncbi:MAG: ribonuclease III domain-containing protein [Christensenellales bacterium]|jgi:ribonuclease-3 family protein
MSAKGLVFTGERMSRAEAMRLNPRQWAFVGDTVYSLFVRTRILTTTDFPLAKMHKLSVTEVNSAAQAEVLDMLESRLSEDEQDILRRGRRIRTRSSHSRNDPAQYSKATALEALVGFLYLTGEDKRLEEIMAMIFSADDSGEES